MTSTAEQPPAKTRMHDVKGWAATCEQTECIFLMISKKEVPFLAFVTWARRFWVKPHSKAFVLVRGKFFCVFSVSLPNKRKGESIGRALNSHISSHRFMSPHAIFRFDSDISTLVA